ncbi:MULTISPECIES: TfoX/Sxy family protein [Pacificibacter]|uniref:TfoX/Sxy family protein n=1 Tax=Pacificibacter TaxID=1042323 RepID=UPI001C08D4D9|nr:TfoX/Sxy family protein [Pacificibacter sp. 1_MG-2023]MBU2936268.1 TfoX/Sxy family protein [Pacificibacter marinus]MDO6616737.1 TfoX/Sxy family protein [Pacificibacter sp. 1_MG-2023]
MPAPAELIAHARDLFADISEITVGGLFGGSALYVEGDIMFACIIGGTIYMKSDKTTVDAFVDAGSEPFTYPKKGGETVVTSLMSLPESASDDPDEARDWARLSYAPALKATEKKRIAKAKKAARKQKAEKS